MVIYTTTQNFVALSLSFEFLIRVPSCLQIHSDGPKYRECLSLSSESGRLNLPFGGLRHPRQIWHQDAHIQLMCLFLRLMRTKYKALSGTLRLLVIQCRSPDSNAEESVSSATPTKMLASQSSPAANGLQTWAVLQSTPSMLYVLSDLVVDFSNRIQVSTYLISLFPIATWITRYSAFIVYLPYKSLIPQTLDGSRETSSPVSLSVWSSCPRECPMHWYVDH